MTEKAVAVTDGTFEEAVLRQELPVLVDFWAEWCGACRLLKPRMDELAADRAGEWQVATVDAGSNPGVVATYDVRALPTLLVFHGGELRRRTTSVRSKQDVVEFMASLSAGRPDDVG